jgi:hypothetical protein
VAGVFLLGFGVRAARAAMASPSSAAYRDRPKGDQNRANCSLFVSSNECKLEGVILFSANPLRTRAKSLCNGNLTWLRRTARELLFSLRFAWRLRLCRPATHGLSFKGQAALSELSEKRRLPAT